MTPTERGRIVTFYSYKGGTGRSMALANFAWILAASGERVLTIDWDLEAPGLHRYFRPFLIDPDLLETDGLIDTFWNLAGTALASARKPDSGIDAAGLDQTKRRLSWKFATGGYIDFVGAGRQGATYSERVNTFDWKRFYELGGARLLSQAKNDLSSQYDWVLIDSRTGVSDTSGICTMQLPDSVVTCFTMNRQSIDGVHAILQSIRSFRSPTADGSRITLFPLATRIENAEKERLEVARKYARNKLVEFVPALPSGREYEYWDGMEVAYRPYYAFEEVLSAFGDATGSTRATDSMLVQMELMARAVAGDHGLRMPEVLETDRQKILAKYSLGEGATSPRTGSVARKPDDDGRVLDDGSSDLVFLRGLLAKEQLWQKGNFHVNDLMSRRELDLLSEKDRMQFGRSMSYYLANSERGQVYFRYLVTLFILDLVATAAVLVAAYFELQRLDATSSSSYYLTNFFPLMTMAGVAAWFGAAIVSSTILALAGNVPYGVSFMRTLFRLATGYVANTIRDYDSHRP